MIQGTQPFLSFLLHPVAYQWHPQLLVIQLAPGGTLLVKSRIVQQRQQLQCLTGF